jgi:hypothetical protein
MHMRLLTTKNTKIQKSTNRGYLTFGLHLLPGRTCPNASKGCLASCLNTAGHGAYRSTQEARARKTQFFWNDLFGFLDQLKLEIRKAAAQARRKGLTPCFRLNLTSDIPWECYGIPQSFPELIFYDYCKSADRHVPSNYHLTFSRSESLINHDLARKFLRKGGNVAVVFNKKELPATYWGYRVHSGDNDDLRFLDPFGVIGLTAKGKAKKDSTGFVVAA